MPVAEPPVVELPEGALPAVELPEGAVPEGALLEGALPEGEAPEGEAPEGEAPEGEAVEGELAEGEAAGVEPLGVDPPAVEPPDVPIPELLVFEPEAPMAPVLDPLAPVEAVGLLAPLALELPDWRLLAPLLVSFELLPPSELPELLPPNAPPPILPGVLGADGAGVLDAGLVTPEPVLEPVPDGLEPRPLLPLPVPPRPVSLLFISLELDPVPMLVLPLLEPTSGLGPELDPTPLLVELPTWATRTGRSCVEPNAPCPTGAGDAKPSIARTTVIMFNLLFSLPA